MKKAVNRFIPRTRKLGSTVVKRLDVNSIQDFYILLSDPHKAYLPGDKIQGEIFLTLNKNLLNISIDLSLIGNIKIKNSMSTSSFRTKKKTLFNHVIRIYPGLEQELALDSETDDEYEYLKNGLTKGQHVFPFIAQLPKENIFTSITFEKGSIGYKLKGSIGELKNEDDSPLFTCEKLLNVVKPINVATLPAPKIRTLIVKYPTKKLRKTASQTSTINSSNISVASLDNTTNNNSTGTNMPSPDSPMGNNLIVNNIDKSRIKLSVEVPNLGYLRGELVPVKVTLQHIKRVTNMSGIIITLIRICKVDFGPDGPVQSFRKDLSQTIAPLFVDPTTFTAEINSSVRIPADVFPTIMGNDLISFQYSIEVIVNLSNNKGLNNNFQEKVQDDEDLNVISTSKNMNNQIQPNASGESPKEYFSINNSQMLANNIFNVDKLKRMKNVLTLNTEVVIGTKRKELRRRRTGHRSHSKPTVHGIQVSDSSSTAPSIQQSNDDYAQPPPIQGYSRSLGSSPAEVNSLISSSNYSQNIGLSTPSPTSRGSTQVISIQVPPPLPLFDNLTEKQILRLRENTLLPSEPSYNIQEDSSLTTLDNHPRQMLTLHEGQDVGATEMMLMDTQHFHPLVSPSSSNEVIDYVPMYEEVEQPNVDSQQQQQQKEQQSDENDLYTRSKLVTQIQGISVDVSHEDVGLDSDN